MTRLLVTWKRALAAWKRLRERDPRRDYTGRHRPPPSPEEKPQ